MGILDTIKSRLRGVAGDDYADDEYYEEGYEGEEGGYAPEPRRRDTGSSPRLLGTTPRPEAESVSVFTRSGRPVGPAAADLTTRMPRPYAPAADVPAQPRSSTFGGSGAPTPGDLGPKTISRPSSGQLPPYVLRPVSYDDVQTVVRRVRTNQPVVVVFRNTNTETAKRILDFCFGLSFGLDGEVRELGDRVFAVLPAGIDLSKADLDKLVADGDLVR